jgi:hypothetical protein
MATPLMLTLRSWPSTSPSRYVPALASIINSHALTLHHISQVPEPREIHNFRTYLIAIIMCMGAAAYGCE